MRSFLLASLLLASSVCLAQKQSVYFLKEDGSLINNKDSASYIRVVNNPDLGSVLYNVIEYYADGKKRLIGKSKTIYPITWEGICLTFYKNGRRKATENYENGRLVGPSDEYYSNGQLFVHKEHLIKEALDPENALKISSFTVVEAYDSLGTAKVKNGNGIYSGYSEEETVKSKVTEEGPVKNGLRSGAWTGFDKEYNTKFEEVYDNGELISGKAVCNGKSTIYSKSRIKFPEFPGRDEGLIKYLIKAIKYPVNEIVNNTQGTVYVSFAINKTGAVTDAEIFISVSKGLDNAALQVVNSFPKWLPGTIYGSPEKIRQVIPISFSLSQ